MTCHIGTDPARGYFNRLLTVNEEVTLERSKAYVPVPMRLGETYIYTSLFNMYYQISIYYVFG